MSSFLAAAAGPSTSPGAAFTDPATVMLINNAAPGSTALFTISRLPHLTNSPPTPDPPLILFSFSSEALSWTAAANNTILLLDDNPRAEWLQEEQEEEYPIEEMGLNWEARAAQEEEYNMLSKSKVFWKQHTRERKASNLVTKTTMRVYHPLVMQPCFDFFLLLPSSSSSQTGILATRTQIPFHWLTTNAHPPADAAAPLPPLLQSFSCAKENATKKSSPMLLEHLHQRSECGSALEILDEVQQ